MTCSVVQHVPQQAFCYRVGPKILKDTEGVDRKPSLTKVVDCQRESGAIS